MEKLINFNTDMVLAILDGRKTQTRRPMRDQPNCDSLQEIGDICFDAISGNMIKAVESAGRNKRDAGILTPKVIKRRYEINDTLCVRESARLFDWSTDTIFGGQGKGRFSYEADHAQTGWVVYPNRLKLMKEGNCCPNGCFKELVRTKRKVLDVRIERVQGISEADAMAEGIVFIDHGENKYGQQKRGWAIKSQAERGSDYCLSTARLGFGNLWNSVYGEGSWDRNDWVEVTVFEGPKKK